MRFDGLAAESLRIREHLLSGDRIAPSGAGRSRSRSTPAAHEGRYHGLIGEIAATDRAPRALSPSPSSSRARPQFPAKWLCALIAVCIGLFIAQLGAVVALAEIGEELYWAQLEGFGLTMAPRASHARVP